MAFLKKVNNARTTITQNINSSALSVTVDDPSDFPISGDFLATIWDNVTYPDPSDDPNQEIVKVTNVSGSTFTIERAVDNTTAHSHSNNHALQMLITSLHFTEIEDAIDALATDEVFNENLTSQLDGITNSFTTDFDYEPGTLQVYLNGFRQAETFEFIETGNNTFDIVGVPDSDWTLYVDYIKQTSLSVSTFVFNENLSSQVGGGNSDFTTAFDFISGSIKVYYNGQRQALGVGTDIIETGSNTFEFIIAPEDESKVIVDYIKS